MQALRSHVKPENAVSTITVGEVNQRLDKILAPPATGASTAYESPIKKVPMAASQAVPVSATQAIPGRTGAAQAGTKGELSTTSVLPWWCSPEAAPLQSVLVLWQRDW